MPGALKKSTWILQYPMRTGSVPSLPHLRQEEGFHCPSIAMNLEGTIPLSPYPSIKYCWNWLTVSEAIRRDGQTHTAKSKSVLWTWTLESPHCLVYRKVSWGFTSFSLGIGKPELVCKSCCLMFAPPNKLLLPCYTVVIYLWQIKRLLMISLQGYFLLL